MSRKPDPVGFGIHGIVEVARVLAVDGDQRDVAQVGSLAERRGLRAFASASAAAGNDCGMSWVWMTIRLTDRASPIAPSRSMMRAGFRPSRW